MDYYNKHYIRLDVNNCIMKGFSDAFEQSEEGDICINQEGGRHFELLGQVNPPLFNMKGQPIFVYEKEVIRELTAEEQGTLYPAPAPQPSELDTLKQENAVLKSRITLVEDAFNEMLLGGGV